VPTATLGDYQLEIAIDFGPRVIGLRNQAGPEVLARLGPDARISHPGGVYRFHGGHRLWAAPEMPEITYANDDHPCHVDLGDESVRISAEPDAAGMRKEMTVIVQDQSLIVDHSLTRVAGDGDDMAAWAITQLPPGGTALLPVEGPDTGPLPNRGLVLWPYTSLTDERIRYVDRGLELEVSSETPAKFGTGPQRPVLGYLRDGWLFVKEVVSSTEGQVPDLGAGSQVYVGQGFCELETLGALTSGSAALLTERWSLHPCDDLEKAWDLLTRGVSR